MKVINALVVICALAVGGIGFLGLSALGGTQLPIREGPTMAALTLTVAIVLITLWRRLSRESYALMQDAVPVAVLVSAVTIVALATAYQLANYLMLPVDLLSFAESPFINDILKFQLGVPIYTVPSDNNSYPYAPGTQLLTYFISAAFGHGDSIPFYRVVQFSYVVLASVVATSLCDLLARKFLTAAEYRHRPLWMTAWLALFFLLVNEPRFNEYTYSLHNDGLSLLVSVSAFWLIVKHSCEARPWVLGLMAVLPALGFMVKQSQVVWAGIFFVYLLTAHRVSWRQLIYFSFCCAALVVAAVALCYLLWGEPFLFWTFMALGQKSGSLLRSLLNLLHAGAYAIMGLFGGWMLVLRENATKGKGLWVCWLLIFAIEVYTSGLGWRANHLGPGIVIGACWFFPALIKFWPTADQAESWWQHRIKQVFAVSAVVLSLGALNLVRLPQNPVSPDLFRYVSDIEKEFVGFAPDRVLMDTGNWIYLREKVLMKDRSETVGIWVGKNQPINHDFLAETIKRIEAKTYDKILARQLDTDQSWYDFQDRGSGVKAAILANYQPIRRVPAAQGAGTWRLPHLLSEILVLVPKHSRNGHPVDSRAAEG